MHARGQIRAAFITAVQAIPNITVYDSRIFPFYDSVLTAVSVYSREEAIDTENGRKQREQHRTLLVTVEGYLKADENLDTDFDSLSESLEQVIMVDTNINNLVRCLDLVSTEMTVSLEAEKETGIVTQTYSCKYITKDGIPEVILI